MRKIVKKVLSFLLTAVLSLSLTGCDFEGLIASSREVENLELIRTVGVDTGEDGRVTITAASATSSSDSEAKLYQNSAETLSQAINDMQKLPVGKEALFSHVEHIILSEKAAQDGISEYLDYVERASDVRIDTNFFVVKGGDAKGLISDTSGKGHDISELLKFLSENIGNLGWGNVFTGKDIASSLAENGCALIQAITAKEAETSSESQPEKTVEPAGLAVIKDGKLVSFLSQEESCGTMLLMNKVKSEDLTVSVDGVAVSLIINDAKTGYSPVYSDSGALERVDVTIDIDANISSVSGELDIRAGDIRGKIEQKLSELEKSRVMAALSASQGMNADYMKINKAVSLKKPVKFEKMPESWEDIFPNLSFSVNVNSVIKRTFDIDNPANTDGKETVSTWETAIK